MYVKIPVEDMVSFLKKWNKKRRLSIKTPEEYEQIEADNPSNRDSTIDISLDGVSLECWISSSINWYPPGILRIESDDPVEVEMAPAEEWENDQIAEKLMEAYGCDRGCCWHFERHSYNWNEKPILSPQKLSMVFQAHTIDITTGHFITTISCDSKTLKTVHPKTGQEYTLTLHKCEHTQHNFADIEEKGIIYPEYCQALSYSVSPEMGYDLFEIRDCAEGDQPRTVDTSVGVNTSVCSVSVFMAEKNTAPNNRVAFSSLYFEPVPTIQWRIIFQIKLKDSIETNISIPSTDFAKEVK